MLSQKCMGTCTSLSLLRNVTVLAGRLQADITKQAEEEADKDAALALLDFCQAW